MLRIQSKTVARILNASYNRNILKSSSIQRFYCDKKDPEKLEVPESKKIENIEIEAKLSGFAKAYQKLSEPKKDDILETPATFESLLRNSKLMELGDPTGKIVVGKIFHTVDDDLYIDFGWKFYCVCTRPSRNGSAYVRGARVKLRIKELELSTKFLGSSKDLTLLEADCQLAGLMSSPALPPRTNM